MEERSIASPRGSDSEGSFAIEAEYECLSADLVPQLTVEMWTAFVHDGEYWMCPTVDLPVVKEWFWLADPPQTWRCHMLSCSLAPVV